MASQAMDSDLERRYEHRFSGIEAQRDMVWEVLTRHYLQRWVKPTDTVLDLGAGYCEFINHVQACRKYALDLNPVAATKTASDVTMIVQDVTERWNLQSCTIDAVFSSNFFEHLPSKKDLTHCLAEIHRVLRPDGVLIAMGPNIRFCYDVYWDFFDHYLPLSDRSMLEALEVAGFVKQVVIPRFLPFTMKGNVPSHTFLLRMYLSLPVLWRLVGKQFLIAARKA